MGNCASKGKGKIDTHGYPVTVQRYPPDEDLRSYPPRSRSSRAIPEPYTPAAGRSTLKASKSTESRDKTLIAFNDQNCVPGFRTHIRTAHPSIVDYTGSFQKEAPELSFRNVVTQGPHRMILIMTELPPLTAHQIPTTVYLGQSRRITAGTVCQRHHARSQQWRNQDLSIPVKGQSESHEDHTQPQTRLRRSCE